jgi:heme exporter protein B
MAAVDGLEPSLFYDELAILISLDSIGIALSIILFPYLWRS